MFPAISEIKQGCSSNYSGNPHDCMQNNPFPGDMTPVPSVSPAPSATRFPTSEAGTDSIIEGDIAVVALNSGAFI